MNDATRTITDAGIFDRRLFDATYWVTAATEEEAVEKVKGQTRGLDLRIELGRKNSVILVDVTSRDDDPEVVDVRDDDGKEPE